MFVVAVIQSVMCVLQIAAQPLLLSFTYLRTGVHTTMCCITYCTDDYDFIAVTERMDESLVVWKILFHLEVSDILYIKSRTSGSFSNGDASHDRPCIYLQPSFLSPGMQKFFDSDQWKQSNAVDILLYQAVYKSLDNTIRDIGQDVFDKELAQFREAQQKANEYCQDKVIGFCSSGGILNPPKDRTCVIWGEGCDYACLREFQQQQRDG